MASSSFAISGEVGRAELLRVAEIYFSYADLFVRFFSFFFFFFLSSPPTQIPELLAALWSIQLRKSYNIL